MNYLISYKLFERNDIELSNLVNNYYDRMLDDIAKMSNSKSYMILSKDITGFLLTNYVTPIMIIFSKVHNGYGFGYTIDNEPFIVIPYSDSNLFLIKRNPDWLGLFKRHPEIIKHEITHYIDWVKYDRHRTINKIITTSQYTPEQGIDSIRKYFNHYKERNAYYIEGSSSVVGLLKKGFLDPLQSFDKFMRFMISDNTKDMKDNLTEKNKKKFYSRCYKLFTDLKSIYEK